SLLGVCAFLRWWDFGDKPDAARRAYLARRVAERILTGLPHAACCAEPAEIGDGLNRQVAMQEQWQRMHQSQVAQVLSRRASHLIFETAAEVKEAEPDASRDFRYEQIGAVMLCVQYLERLAQRLENGRVARLDGGHVQAWLAQRAEALGERLA